MILNDDHQLYKGVFWIIDSENLENNKNYCFTIPSDQYGNVASTDLELNAKSGTTYNHEKLWKSLPDYLLKENNIIIFREVELKSKTQKQQFI